jgi:hypothetical protein
MEKVEKVEGVAIIVPGINQELYTQKRRTDVTEFQFYIYF